MEIKTISSTFPSEINEVLKEILRHTTDGVQIRDKLQLLYADVWIVVEGKDFSYVVSRASKSAGVFNNKTKGLKFLIYTPPYTEITPYNPPLSEFSESWNITLIKKNPGLSEILSKLFLFIKTLDYADSSLACETIKIKANEFEEKFWHVFVGKNFTVTLPFQQVQYLLYAKANKNEKSVDIVVFRQQGLQRKIDWKGFIEGTCYLVLTLVFFLGILGLIKCEGNSETWLCNNYKSLLYVGLAFVFSKATKFFMKKIKNS